MGKRRFSAPAGPVPATAAEDTIRTFGEQWSHYTQNHGYYGSLDLFADILGPLLAPSDFARTCVADIGSGSGRIVAMLVASGATHVTAVEPSDAFDVLARNTHAIRDRVRLLRTTGDQLPAGLELDFVVSIGVLHHIPDAAAVLRAAHDALRPGGQVVIWVYALEGNERYLKLTAPIRQVTTRLPHRAVATLSHLLALLTTAYATIARWSRLPARKYLQAVFLKLPYRHRHLVVYDQLRPRYTRHYAEAELVRMLEDCGFRGVRTHHRHGYSWTVVGRKVDLTVITS